MPKFLEIPGWLRGLAAGCWLLASLSAAAQVRELPREARSPEVSLSFAEGLMARKFYDVAENELREFLRAHGDHELAPRAAATLVECLRQRRETGAALAMIDEFLRRWSGHALSSRLLLERGLVLADEKRFAEAAECFRGLAADTASAAAGVREAARYNLGLAWNSLGRPAEALAAFSQLAEADAAGGGEYRPYAVWQMALIHQRQGDWRQAQKLLKTPAGLPAAPPELRHEALYRLGETCYQQGDFAAALAYHDRLLLEAVPGGGMALAAGVYRIRCLFSLGRYAEAMAAAAAWREKHPDGNNFELDYLHAASLLGEGKAAAAAPLFSRLLEAQETPPEYRRLAAVQLLNSLALLPGREDELLRTAAAYRARFPQAGDRADVHFAAAQALHRVERFKEAAEELRLAMAAAGDDWPRRVDAGALLAVNLERDGKLQEAAAEFRRLAELPLAGERAPYFLHRSALLERRAGNLPAAAADLRLLLERHAAAAGETVADASLLLAQICMDTAEYAAAAALVEPLLAGATGAARVRFLLFLGLARRQQGQDELAAAHLREAVTLTSVETDPQTAQTARLLLAATLMDLHREEEGLDMLGDYLRQRTAAGTKVFADPLLLKMQEEFLARGRLAEAEIAGRALLEAGEPQVRHQGVVGLAMAMLGQKKSAAAVEFLRAALAAGAAGETDGARRAELLSLLGHAHLETGDHDRAVEAFVQSLSGSGLAPEFAVRARWGLATILLKEGHDREALDYASTAFILANEPYFTPRCMWMAIEILLRQGRREEAATTWRELGQRFPEFAGQQTAAAAAAGL